MGVTHGVDIGPHNVGLRGAGVWLGDLTPVKGGKASALANGTTEDGRHLLRRLDITGQLTVDVPCVLSECRLAVTGGLYGVRGNAVWEAGDCDFAALSGEDGGVASCVLLYPRVLRRCVVRGGSDGVKVARAGGCLIEECWVYGQVKTPGSHNDAVQMTGGGGEGDWDHWTFRRSRFEGPFRQSTSAMILQVDGDAGDLAGVTVADCLLSGGSYCLYTRLKDPARKITKLRVIGNVFAESWTSGPWSSDVRADEWSGNRIAPAVEGTPVAVDMAKARVYSALGSRAYEVTP